MKKYASLHNHTDMSNASCGFADSINKIDTIVDQAKELGFHAIAITDHECISNHVNAIKVAKAKEMKVILGNEIYLARRDLTQDTYQKGEKFFHMILLAKDAKGHEGLRKLSTRAWDRGFMRAIMRRFNTITDFEEIMSEYKGHIIATSACIGGMFGSLLFQYGEVEAAPIIKSYIETFYHLFGKENYFIELAPGTRGDQLRFNKFMLSTFPTSEYNYVVATDSHYGRKDDFEIFKTFLDSKSTKDREVEDFYEHAHLMTWEEIIELMPYASEEDMEHMRLNTLAIADSVEEFDLQRDPVIPYIKIDKTQVLNTLPATWEKYENIKKYYTSEFLPDRHLLFRILQGYDKLIRPEQFEEASARINVELGEVWGISEKLNQRLSDYLLTVEKIIDLIWTEADGLVGPSRGSAGAFIINYLIGVTQWNPLDYPVPIPHWRFITATRPELPDVDLDAAGNKRQEILVAVADYFQKEMNGSVIQVCTFKTEKAKSAIRTAARGLGVDDTLAMFISSLVPAERGQQLSITQCYYGDDEHEPVKSFVKAMDENPALFNVASRIEGLITGLGVHAAGVLLCNNDLTENNSMMRTSKGIPVTAFELKDCEYLGYVKYDFLSIDGLGKMTTCLHFMLQDNVIEWQGSLKATYDKYLSPDVLTYDDNLWAAVASSEINSLWQLNTPVGVQALAAIHATSLKEVGIINSLMRLQPQRRGDEQPISTYARFKEDINQWYIEMQRAGLNKKEVELMEKHLLVLNGIADTQESIMLLSMDPEIAGFSIQEANKLRKGIAKKSKKAQDEAKALFYKHGEELGTRKTLLDYVWDVQIGRQLG